MMGKDALPKFNSSPCPAPPAPATNPTMICHGNSSNSVLDLPWYWAFSKHFHVQSSPLISQWSRWVERENIYPCCTDDKTEVPGVNNLPDIWLEKGPGFLPPTVLFPKHWRFWSFSWITNSRDNQLKGSDSLKNKYVTLGPLWGIPRPPEVIH